MSDGVSPRAMRVMAVVRIALLMFVTALAGASLYRAWGPVSDRVGAAPQGRFYCPMHPEITASAPGECPICHMALVALDAPGDHAASHAHSHTESAPRDASEPSDASVTGALTTVMLTLDRQQLGGVVSEPVRRATGGATLRVPAVIEAPEGGRAEVRVRAAGFVERVAVRESGARVARGQVLAWVYAPQVFQAQQELLTATQWSAQPGNVRAAEVAAAARQSLELLGMSPADIDAVVAARAPLRAVPLRSTAAGTVVRANAVQGAYATPDAALYELADLTRVWAVASVWERDLSRIRVGATARFESGAVSARATVLRVEPALATDSRSARVRLDVPNGSMALRPGAYGEAVFEAPRDGGIGALEVPRDAVIDTGTERYVFVQTGDGVFAPRAVRTGSLRGDRLEVFEGLTEGERVVSRGTFMVDSESRLRAALARGAR